MVIAFFNCCSHVPSHVFEKQCIHVIFARFSKDSMLLRCSSQSSKVAACCLPMEKNPWMQQPTNTLCIPRVKRIGCHSCNKMCQHVSALKNSNAKRTAQQLFFSPISFCDTFPSMPPDKHVQFLDHCSCIQPLD